METTSSLGPVRRKGAAVPTTAPSTRIEDGGPPSVRSMTIEAIWNVPVGQPISVEISAPGMSRPVRLEGTAVQVTTMTGPSYAIVVEFRSETSMERRPTRSEESGMRTLARVSSEVCVDVDDWFDLDAQIGAPSTSGSPEHEHLRGALARFPLASLCALLEMDRISGKLTLVLDDKRVVLLVRDGRFVDVRDGRDDHPGRTPRERLWDLLGWKRGTFDLDVCSVACPDRIGCGMTELLLDHARLVDERASAGS